MTEQVALVTGASSGIGEATARALADDGVQVALTARREGELERIVEEISSNGGEAIAVPADVRDDAQVEAMVETTRDAFGEIDILVNNAGTGVEKTFVGAEMEDLRRVVETNLLGAMSVTHAVLPGMLDAGGGQIVVVSSMNARHPASVASGYTATKFGINGFCRALRKELADEDVQVTILMPGAVSTELKDWEEWDGRALDPSDVAEGVLFAVSRPEHVWVPELTINTKDLVP